MKASEIWDRFKEGNEDLRPFAEALEKHWEGVGQYDLETLSYVRDGSDGYNGFIWYSDTTDFYERNREVILSRLKETHKEYGYESVIGMVSDFGGISGNYGEDEIAVTLYTETSVEGIADCLAKYVLEEVAVRFQDFIGEEGIDVTECED